MTGSLIANRFAYDRGGQLFDLATGLDVALVASPVGDDRHAGVLDSGCVDNDGAFTALTETLPAVVDRTTGADAWERVVGDALDDGPEDVGPLRELQIEDADGVHRGADLRAIACYVRRIGYTPVSLAGLHRLPTVGTLARRSVVIMSTTGPSAGPSDAHVPLGARDVVAAAIALAAIRARVALVISARAGQRGMSWDAGRGEDVSVPAALGHVAEPGTAWPEVDGHARRDRWLQCLRGAQRRRDEVAAFCRTTVALATERFERLSLAAAEHVARDARLWRRWWTPAVPTAVVLRDMVALLELEHRAITEQAAPRRTHAELEVGLWAARAIGDHTVEADLRATAAAGLRLAGAPDRALAMLGDACGEGAGRRAQLRWIRERLWAAALTSDWRRTTEVAAMLARSGDTDPYCRGLSARELAVFHHVVGDHRARDAALDTGRAHWAALPRIEQLRFEMLVRASEQPTGNQTRSRRAGGPLEGAAESPAMRLERRQLASATPPGRRDANRDASGDAPLATREVCPGHQTMKDVLELLKVLECDEDESRTLDRACGVLRERLGATSVGLWTAEGERPLAGAGSGRVWAAGLAGRSRVAGLPLGPDVSPHGAEVAWPVGHGGAILGAIGCRWLPDSRVELERVQVLLTAATTACAPLVRTWLDRAAAPVAEDALGLLGESRAMRDLRAGVRRAANVPYHVLVEGESGSGKELVARATHVASARKPRKFCAINCAALTDELLEAELFGHTRGAFTGAIAERAGLFEEATGGTLFLDEVADLSPRGQAKILRVLQDGEVRRVGESFARRVDVRIVAASNKPLREEAAHGRFREDLRYRLDVLRLVVPPLRERPEDIGLLAGHFWREAASRVGSQAVLDARLLSALSRYDWPGNVRELQNVVAFVAVHAPRRGRVGPSLLPERLRCSPPGVASASLAEARRRFDVEYVRATLARCAGRRADAARSLGVTRQGLTKLMTRLGLERIGA